MNLTEGHIEITAKMYAARRTVVSLLGEDKFRERVDGFRPLFEDFAAKRGFSDIEATVELLKDLDQYGASGMERLIVLASCVELLEPSLTR